MTAGLAEEVERLRELSFLRDLPGELGGFWDMVIKSFISYKLFILRDFFKKYF